MKSSNPGATRGSTRNVALVLQEILTAVVRLRSNPETVSDAESFRAQMIDALRRVEAEGRQLSYSGDDMRLAIFAVVAFLDESVLNSRTAVFASWPRKPLQEELFGVTLAGETFYINIERLLKSPDSASVADVLEVYQLCLLLGYAGRYTLGNRGELAGIKQAIAEKIQRIRGEQPFAPLWAPAEASAPRVGSDPVVRWLLYSAIGCAVLCVLLFGIFKLSLASNAAAIAEVTNRQVVAR